MPKKVILHGDALKLLYTFLEYGEADPERVAHVLDYNLEGFKERRAQLARQIEDGVSVEWDDLERELQHLKESKS